MSIVQSGLAVKTFVWDASFEVGHPRVDREHQALVGLINQVFALQGKPDAAAQLPKILEHLLQYAAEHFSAEEALMDIHQVNEGHVRNHRAAHQGFVKAVRDMQTAPLQDGQLRRTAEFLKGWLVGHILTLDRALMLELRRHTQTADKVLRDIVQEQRATQMVLSQVIEGSPIATLVLDDRHRVTQWNRACVQLTGVPAHEMVGTNQPWRGLYTAARPLLANLLLIDQPLEALTELYGQAWRRSPGLPGAVEADIHFPHLGEHGRWLRCIAAPLHNEQGELIGAVETLQDVTAHTQGLRRLNHELAEVNDRLERVRQCLLQSDQRAADAAHGPNLNQCLEDLARVHHTVQALQDMASANHPQDADPPGPRPAA